VCVSIYQCYKKNQLGWCHDVEIGGGVVACHRNMAMVMRVFHGSPLWSLWVALTEMEEIES